MDHGEADASLPSSKIPNECRNQDIPSAARAKSRRILDACEKVPDIEALVQLATSTDGLINDEVRRKACTFAR